MKLNFSKSTIALISILSVLSPLFSQGLIINHDCTDISVIPDLWINELKVFIKLHYAHTSHGAQLTAGIQILANPSQPVYDPRLTYTLQFQSLPDSTELDIMDGQLFDVYISPDEYWENGGHHFTRDVINTYPAINVSMWSWCRQMNIYTDTPVLQR